MLFISRGLVKKKTMFVSRQLCKLTNVNNILQKSFSVNATSSVNKKVTNDTLLIKNIMKLYLISLLQKVIQMLQRNQLYFLYLILEMSWVLEEKLEC